jgi:hypothetical protein
MHDDNKSGFVIVYAMMAMSGALVGLAIGWLVWG